MKKVAIAIVTLALAAGLVGAEVVHDTQTGDCTIWRERLTIDRDNQYADEEDTVVAGEYGVTTKEHTYLWSQMLMPPDCETVVFLNLRNNAFLVVHMRLNGTYKVIEGDDSEDYVDAD